MRERQIRKKAMMDRSFVSAVAGIVLFFGALLFFGSLATGEAAVGFGGGILFDQHLQNNPSFPIALM